MSQKEYGTIGLIGRFKPLHLGGAAVLDQATAKADYVKIALGSANIGTDNYPLNMRNPFTVEETETMVNLYLKDKGTTNYEIVKVNDHFGEKDKDDNDLWKVELTGKLGNLDTFVSGNEYVAGLLADKYSVISSYDFIDNPPDVRASEIRYNAASGQAWTHLVPPKIAVHLEQSGLIRRMVEEFGEEILKNPPAKRDCAQTELANVTAGRANA